MKRRGGNVKAFVYCRSCSSSIYCQSCSPLIQRSYPLGHTGHITFRKKIYATAKRSKQHNRPTVNLNVNLESLSAHDQDQF